MLSFYRVPEVYEYDMPDAPEPVLDVAPGDDVIAHGKNGVDYKGFVRDTDPYQGLALVQIVDPTCPNSKHVAWWGARHLTKRAQQHAAPYEAAYRTGYESAKPLALGTEVRLLDGTAGVISGRIPNDKGCRYRISYYSRRCLKVEHCWVERRDFCVIEQTAAHH